LIRVKLIELFTWSFEPDWISKFEKLFLSVTITLIKAYLGHDGALSSATSKKENQSWPSLISDSNTRTGQCNTGR